VTMQWLRRQTTHTNPLLRDNLFSVGVIRANSQFAIARISSCMIKDVFIHECGYLTRIFSVQMQKIYLNVRRESETFGLCALIALVMSCIGLFALTVSVAERRTRDFLKLLLWQFSQPVAWASHIAWPVSGYIMSRWLSGFAYHSNLPPISGLKCCRTPLGGVCLWSRRGDGLLKGLPNWPLVLLRLARKLLPSCMAYRSKGHGTLYEAGSIRYLEG
jgi:hypothetical protein